MTLFHKDKKMTLTFELDTELARVFDFVTEYKGDDKNDLFLLWKGTKSVHSFSQQTASDTVPVEIEVESEDIGEFNYLCKYENITPDAWFEAHVRGYCVKGLSDIQKKIQGFVAVTPLPDDSRKERGMRELTPAEKHNLYVVGYIHAWDLAGKLYPNIGKDSAQLVESAKRLGVSESTLRASTRDRFDYWVKKKDSNHSRVGWQHQSQEIQDFFEEYELKDKEEVLAEARAILGL